MNEHNIVWDINDLEQIADDLEGAWEDPEARYVVEQYRERILISVEKIWTLFAQEGQARIRKLQEEKRAMKGRGL